MYACGLMHVVCCIIDDCVNGQQVLSMLVTSLLIVITDVAILQLMSDLDHAGCTEWDV